MRTKLNLAGKRFGNVYVLAETTPSKSKHSRWVCICDCENKFVATGTSLNKGKTVSCGCFHKKRVAEMGRANAGANHPCWKGGRGSAGNGYISVWTGLKRENGTKIRVLEHIMVMEKTIGRELLPGETVHHKNGIRSDNRPENLELKASNHGMGQTIPDLVYWAKEILYRYEPEFLLKCHN